MDDVDTLSVQAFDRQGNLFTSLEGMGFDWNIKNLNVLAHSKLGQSSYKMTPTRKRIEEAGQYSDVVLVRGKTTGYTQVSVREKLSSISSDEVQLVISENLMLLPTHLLEKGVLWSDLPSNLVLGHGFSFECSPSHRH